MQKCHISELLMTLIKSIGPHFQSYERRDTPTKVNPVVLSIIYTQCKFPRHPHINYWYGPFFFLDNLSPSGWAPMPLDERGNEVAVHTVSLASTCAEYQEVAQRVRQTLPSQNIVSIARIQNPFLYQSYQLRKQKMKKDNGGDNERQLFHGTNPDNVTKINTQGFDRSLSGSANGENS